ncbi:MAG: MFS transporter [Armatimonadetes bacterium]|nr:MFS transporter [Armatimonadota bacterium]
MEGRDREARRLALDWQKLALLTFLFTFGFNIYMGVFQNFFREVLHGDEVGLGGLESMREVPGLIAALMAGILVALAESRIAALGLAITGIGIALTGQATTFWGLTAITVFWSVGFHLYSTVQPAITLNLAKGVEGGMHLGRIRGIGSMATVAAYAIAYLVATPLLPRENYSVFFWGAGAAIFAAAIVSGTLSHHSSGGKRQRLIIRREYGLYYLLVFLDGCRRQIFMIFALFTLIKVYHTPLDAVLKLSLINALVSVFVSKSMGRLIDRVGERLPLTIYAIGLIVVFTGYATIPNATWLMALYVADNFLFGFSIGFTTYLHRIVRPGELTPCLAMGTTMNHVAAVTLPIIGALVWKATGNYQMPFFIGVGLAIVALTATLKLPKGHAGGTEVSVPDLEPSA